MGRADRSFARKEIPVSVNLAAYFQASLKFPVLVPLVPRPPVDALGLLVLRRIGEVRWVAPRDGGENRVLLWRPQVVAYSETPKSNA